MKNIFKIDTSEKKIPAFISSIVMLVFAGVGAFVCFNMGQNIGSQQGLEALSQIVTIPLLLMMFLMTFALNLSGALSAAMSIGSSVKAIKILSIILLILNIVLINLEIYLIMTTI